MITLKPVSMPGARVSKDIKESFVPVLLILLLGFILRITAVNFGLPHLYHADEPIVVNHALAYGSGDFNPHFFKIPPLISYLLFFAYGVFYVAGKVLGVFHGPADFENLFYADPTSFYLIGRLVFGVFAGTLSVYLLYRLIDKYFSRTAALANAFLFSIAFLHIRDSHYIYTDIPLIAVMISSYFVFFRILERKAQVRGHVMAGIMIGIATAIKYNGMAIVIPYLFASWNVPGRRSLLGAWLMASCGALLAFAMLNPYFIFDWNSFQNEIVKQSQSHSAIGWTHHAIYSLANGLGVPILIASGAGLLSILVKRDLQRSCFAVFIIGYYALIGLAGQSYDRYALPLIPFLIFFAADSLIWLSEKFPSSKTTVLWCGVAILGIQPLISSIQFDRLMLAEDTRTLAKRWVETNVSKGSRIALGWDFYMPRLSFYAEQLKEKKVEAATNPFFSKAQTRKLDYLLSHPQSDTSFRLYFLNDHPESADRPLFARPMLPYDVENLRKQGIEYVIVERIQDEKKRAPFYAQLLKEGTLIASFSPYWNRRMEAYDPIPITGGPFLFRDLVLRERNGEPLEVYRLGGKKP